jgi:multidrug efflux pump subunit AcrA (membrane-fusion protein)
MFKSVVYSLLLILLTFCSKKDEKIQPNLTTITESVYSSVIIQPDSLYQVYAMVNGILERNLVEEGDLVSKGAALAQIINTNPKLNAENALLSYNLAQKNYSGSNAILKSLEEKIKAQKLKLINDSINYFRQKNLWDQYIGSKAEYDTKELSYQLSKNSLNLLKSEFGRTKNELQIQLKQAENNYKNSVTTTEDFKVTSKINGKVYALNKNPGEIINTTQPLASIGSANTFIIEMLVDEVDIVKIKKGQEVIIILDAYPDKTFKALVSKIYPEKNERNQTFLVEANFVHAPEILYPGLSGEANIIIAIKKNTLTIPKEYLIEGTKVRTEDGIKEIELGLQSMDVVEILSGITEDTWIYKPEK